MFHGPVIETVISQYRVVKQMETLTAQFIKKTRTHVKMESKPPYVLQTFTAIKHNLKHCWRTDFTLCTVFTLWFDYIFGPI